MAVVGCTWVAAHAGRSLGFARGVGVQPRVTAASRNGIGVYRRISLVGAGWESGSPSASSVATQQARAIASKRKRSRDRRLLLVAHCESGTEVGCALRWSSCAGVSRKPAARLLQDGSGRGKLTRPTRPVLVGHAARSAESRSSRIAIAPSSSVRRRRRTSMSWSSPAVRAPAAKRSSPPTASAGTASAGQGLYRGVGAPERAAPPNSSTSARVRAAEGTMPFCS